MNTPQSSDQSKEAFRIWACFQQSKTKDRGTYELWNSLIGDLEKCATIREYVARQQTFLQNRQRTIDQWRADGVAEDNEMLQKFEALCAIDQAAIQWFATH